MENEELTLKWGTLKGWDLKSEKSMTKLEKYLEFGSSVSAMAQNDTDEQKVALCDLIDTIDGTIYNDWDGVYMSKEDAKKYVMEYGK
jgi:hypothetical protein